MSVEKNHERILVKMPLQAKRKIQDAANAAGLPLSQFLLTAALEKAEMLSQPEQAIHYSRADAAMLIDVLDNPRAPNDALVRAFKRYKARLAEEAI